MSYKRKKIQPWENSPPNPEKEKLPKLKLFDTGEWIGRWDQLNTIKAQR